MFHVTKTRICLLLFIACFFVLGSRPAHAQASHVVISEVYGGGGNSGSTWKNDFIELYNPTTSPISVDGWSVQYGSASGTGSWTVTPISGTIASHHFFLIQEAAGTGGSVSLPTPDITPTPPGIAMSGTSGKVALVNTTTALSGANPGDASIVDKVGYGSANGYEGSPAPTLNNTTSAERKYKASSTATSLAPGGADADSGNGYDTDNNSTDFVAQNISINPQNSASAMEPSTADGSGAATVAPDTMFHGNVYTMTFTYTRNVSYTVTDIRIILPSNFSWSHSTADVGYTSMSTTKSVSGDTIYLNSISFSGNPSTVTIQNVTAPESTAYYSIGFQTKAITDYANIATLPRVVAFGSPIPVGAVRGNDIAGTPLRVGQLVTIDGTVVAATEFGTPSYVQDNTGGISVYGSIFSSEVHDGDEVVVSGQVSNFYGQIELVSPYLHSIVGTGNTITPIVVTCSQIAGDGVGGNELYEGLLVRINAVVVRDATTNLPISTWVSATNYNLTDVTGTTQVRVSSASLAGLSAPQGTFDLIGIVGQHVSSSPYIGGYQILPRYLSDIISGGPIFATTPVESNMTPSSVRISWTTVNDGTSRLAYGTTTSYGDTLAPDDIMGTSHAVDITGLQAATVYHVRAFSVGSVTDTSWAGDLVVSTASPSATTGQMNVYFNFSVNTSVSTGEAALGNQDLVSHILTRINNAQYSIDAALYNLTGSSQGVAIANALASARNRGVRVRVICEHDNRSSSGFTTLTGYSIPLIDDTFDPVDYGAGLMHNKFFVIDAVGGAPENVWVWSGSWNPTVEGTTQDHQNSVEIQDVALANAYTMEFDQMWGSSTTTPNAATSRFGSRKLDITPHNFIINGIPVSSYFSPSDQTTTHIRTTLAKAQHSIAASLLTFTRKDIADTIIARKNAGSKARIVLDDSAGTGSQYTYLHSNGVDIHLKGFSGGLLHHKYAVVDADQTIGTRYAITGSHNWSSAAETSNDENTLIFQSGRIANLYLQEFAARYYEAGGSDPITVSSSPVFSIDKSSINFDSLVIGTSKQDSFVVSNPGTAALVISRFSSTNPRFTVVPDTATVAPAGSQKFIVTFSPTVPGLETGSFILSHNASGSPNTVTVQGKGVRLPFFAADRPAVDLDSVVVGLAKRDSFVVSNTGGTPLVISGVASTNLRFVVSPTTTDTIAVSSSRKFYVVYSPTVLGADTGYVTFTDNDSSGHDTVTVLGWGIRPAIFAVDRSAIDFDTVMVNNSSQDSIVVSNMGDVPLVISGVSTTNARFIVSPTTASIAPSSSEKFYVTFSPMWMGRQSGLVIFADSDSSGHDTVTVQGVGSRPNMVSATLPLTRGWNLLSLPVEVLDGTRSAVFPTSMANAFSYAGGYRICDSLTNHKGYWLKFSCDQTDTMAGFPISTDTVPVSPRWNIIGSISHPVPVDSIVQVPQNNVHGTLWGYNGAYFAADTIFPGKAYWAKADSAGNLYYSWPGHLSKVKRYDLPKGEHRFDISDADGHHQTLYFGAKPDSCFSAELYELPPVPPEGGFDARFGSGRFAEFYEKILNQAAEYRILLHGTKLPIKLSWAIATDKLNSYNLSVPLKDQRSSMDLSSKGEMSFSSTLPPELVLTITPVRPVPAEYVLGQNYPNPFNPLTTIPFALPVRSLVTLKVYNGIGEVVSVPVNGVTFEAGYHEARLDGSRLASGVYYYQMSAVAEEKVSSAFRQARKLLILK